MSVPSANIIELSELRIGNILKYKGKLVHVTRLDRDIDDEYQEIIGFCELGKDANEIGDWNRALAADLSRIPLTPELLERSGFSAFTPKNMMSDASYYFDGLHIVVLHGQSIALICQFQIRIKSLHQLQNLYFSLKGKELPL